MRLFLRGKVWYAQFYDANGERVTKSTRCHDHKAALAVARRFERDAADPGASRPSETLTRALNELLLVSEQRMKDGEITSDTYDYYEGRVRQLFVALETIGEGGAPLLPRRMSDLGPEHIDGYIAHRRRLGVRANTVKKELVVLGMALKIAKRRKWWGGDLDEIMPENFKPEYRPGERWLSREEATRLLAALPKHRAALIAFSIATGARPEEAPRARLEDVGQTRVWLRGSKTDAAPRHVPIVLPWQRELLAFTEDASDGLLFPRWPMIRRDLRKKADALKIGRFSPRDLRRTFAHWMRQAGVPEDLVAKMLGHTSTKMVSRVYAKLGGEEIEAMVRAALERSGAAVACSAGVPDEPKPSDSSDRSDSASPTKSRVFRAPAAGLEPATRWLTGTQEPPVVSVSCHGSEAPAFHGRPPLRRAEDRVTRLVLEGLALATGGAADVDEAGCLALLDEAARLLLERRTA